MSDNSARRGQRQLGGRAEMPAPGERWSASGIAGFSLEELRLPQGRSDDSAALERASRVVTVGPAATLRRTANPMSPPPPAGEPLLRAPRQKKLAAALFAIGAGAVLLIALRGPATLRESAPSPPAPVAPLAAEVGRGEAAPTTAPTADSVSQTRVTPGPVVTAPTAEVASPAEPAVRRTPAPRRGPLGASVAQSVLERPIAPPDD